MKKQILLLCLALTSLCSYAQTITVKGVVTSASDKEPMIGATVQVKGTGTGTITSIDGDYSLNDVAKDAVLVFSSIGYETQEIKVNGQTVINVVLKDASELLDEVVVIGYGAVKKSDLTSSISTVKGKEITETVTGNAMDALQGKINGVQVTSGGGPGAQPKVLIRGVTTVNGTDPLYVVDGMPVGTNINFLNSNDIESMVDSNKVRTGKLEEDDWTKLAGAIGPLSEAEIFIDDTPGINITEIRAKCRKLKLEKNIGMVVIDYLQLIQGSNKRGGSREQEISEISRSLKILAKELDVPVIALSQLSRAAEQRPDHRPMLSDLRESGAIEQDADIVMFLYRDDYYNQDSEKKDIAEIIIAKHRGGSTGTVELLWLGSYTKFVNLERRFDD